jgi:hypothetical protein
MTKLRSSTEHRKFSFFTQSSQRWTNKSMKDSCQNDKSIRCNLIILEHIQPPPSPLLSSLIKTAIQNKETQNLGNKTKFFNSIPPSQLLSINHALPNPQDPSHFRTRKFPQVDLPRAQIPSSARHVQAYQ